MPQRRRIKNHVCMWPDIDRDYAQGSLKLSVPAFRKFGWLSRSIFPDSRRMGFVILHRCVYDDLQLTRLLHFPLFDRELDSSLFLASGRFSTLHVEAFQHRDLFSKH